METRGVLGRRTTMHWEVAGIIINHFWAEGSVMRGRLTEARGIVGDVVRLPVLLFDQRSSGRGRQVASGSGQIGEALR